jgi:hypothetical protein
MITQNYAAIPTKTLTTESVQSQYWSESAFYKTQARFVGRGVGQGRIQNFSYVSQSFRMHNLVLRAVNARGT